MADILGRGHGHGIAGPDHEIVETEAPALAGAGAQRGGRQGQGTLAGLKGPGRAGGRRGHPVRGGCPGGDQRRRDGGGREGSGRGGRGTLTGDADIDALRRHLQHRGGSGTQGLLHAVAQPAGHIFTGCGKAQAVPLDMGIQRMDPHLEDAGIEDAPQVFRNLLPLLLHACHCPPMKNAAMRAMTQPCPARIRLVPVAPAPRPVRLSAERPQGCSFFTLFCQHTANEKTTLPRFLPTGGHPAAYPLWTLVRFCPFFPRTASRKACHQKERSLSP